jgi:UDP-N-acetylmuramyl pentapeptide phosphotransferase/UDP-N-acetylglucosamine-1-phosphate transferase
MLLVYILIPAIVRLSVAKKLFDLPNERRVNKTVVPNLGGIALFAGITIASLLSIQKMQFHDLRYILAAMIIMFYTGLKDDILMITPQKKFIAQFVTAFILVVLGDIRLSNLHGILGVFEINYVFSVLVSLLAFIAITNSINLIDGIDGLATGLGILISGFFGFAFFLDGNLAYAILCASVAGSLLTFFMYNVFGKQNKIFMGDTGSLILGLLFSVMAIKYNEFAIVSPGQVRYYAPALSLAVISVPLFDMVRVFCVRIFRKRSPFLPDMSHIHHKLIRLGYSHLKSTLIIITANLLIICQIYFLRYLDIHLLLVMVLLMEVLFTLLANFMLKRKVVGHMA